MLLEPRPRLRPAHRLNGSESARAPAEGEFRKAPAWQGSRGRAGRAPAFGRTPRSMRTPVGMLSLHGAAGFGAAHGAFRVPDAATRVVPRPTPPDARAGVFSAGARGDARCILGKLRAARNRAAAGATRISFSESYWLYGKGIFDSNRHCCYGHCVGPPHSVCEKGPFAGWTAFSTAMPLSGPWEIGHSSWISGSSTPQRGHLRRTSPPVVVFHGPVPRPTAPPEIGLQLSNGSCENGSVPRLGHAQLDTAYLRIWAQEARHVSGGGDTSARSSSGRPGSAGHDGRLAGEMNGSLWYRPKPVVLFPW